MTGGGGFPGRRPPPPDDEMGDDVHDAQLDRPGMGTPARAANLRVLGSENAPLRQPDLLASIKRWHRGVGDRTTGELQPWRTMILVHADTGRTVQQFDVRTDEDDLELALEIESAQFGQGQRLANNTGLVQNYTVDVYFGTRTDPQAHWSGEVRPQSNVMNIGRSPHMHARGTPQDFNQQDFRRRETEMNVSFGLTQFAVVQLKDMLDKANARIALLESREDSVRERERSLEAMKLQHQLDLAKEMRRAKRNEMIVAGLMRYLPILVSRLDKKLFGLQTLSAEERNDRASKIIKNILGKLPNTPEGTAKFESIAGILELSPADVEEIRNFGVMAWLQEQNEKLARDADLAEKGGFAALGNDVKSMLSEGDKTKMLGEGKKS